MAINFGIVGYGFMGHVHMDMLSKMDGAEVLGVCDIDANQLTDVPANIKTYSSTEEMVKDKKIDVILISANNDQHRQITEVAAAAGKHVLCEKPVALSIDDLDAMEKCCKENHVAFTVHQQRRFDKDFRIAKKVYDSKTLGQMYVVKSYLYGFNGNMHDWHVFKDQGGGMLYDWGVHLIDQMLWMLPGKILSVYADLRNVINKEVDDYFHIILRYESGLIAQIELGTYYLSDAPGWFERHWFIGGDKGSMRVDGFEPEGAIIRTSELLRSVEGKKTMTASGPTRSFGPPPEGRIISEPLPEVEANHKMYFENYINALKGKEPFLVTIDEVRRTLLLMDAVRESARLGRSVPFEPA